MEDKVYLLSLRELEKEAKAEKLSGEITKRLDEHRLFLVKKAGTRQKMLESAGGGLLLQLAVQEYWEQESFVRKQGTGAETKAETGKALRISRVTLQELLHKIKAPFPLQYTYGEGGKPYFLNYPLFFSLSHSGEYVLCAVSEREIGADIQKMSMRRKAAKAAEERLARRFFSKQEVQLLSGCSSCEEKRQLFYELWACKEAFGKLTGLGISRTLGLDMRREREEYLLEAPKGYQLAVCRRLDRMLENIAGK